MCSVFGIGLFKPNEKLLNLIMNAMLGMQNRGKDSSGLACYDTANCNLIITKAVMSAEQWFEHNGDIRELLGIKSLSIVLGHVRYATASKRDVINAQPHQDMSKTLVVSANGDIPFCQAEREKLEALGMVFKSECDGEVIANILSYKIHNENKSEEMACWELIQELDGAFSLVCIMPSGRLVAIRDKRGFRPLWWATDENGIYICSEASVIKRLSEPNEVMPGTMIVANPENKSINISCFQSRDTKTALCAMEFIYFASQASVFTVGNNSKVMDYERIDASIIRRQLGYQAGLKWLKNQEIIPDIISPVPRTGIPASEGFLDCLLSNGHTKCRGISFVRKGNFSPRLFLSSRSHRRDSLKHRLGIETDTVKGKTIAIVDDSIVRGDQSKFLITKLLKANAKMVIIIITAPLYKHPCFYGINTPDTKTLIAHQSNTKGVKNKIARHVAEELGVDWRDIKQRIKIQYLSCSDLYHVVQTDNICTSCFTGKYPTLVPQPYAEV